MHLLPCDWVLERNVVGVAGRDGVVVVCLVLSDRIVPAIANQNCFELDLLCTRELPCVYQNVLLLDVPGFVRTKCSLVLYLIFNLLVEHRSVMAAIALRCKVEPISGVLWEGAHETLQSPPEARCRVLCRVGRVCRAGVGVRSTAMNIVGATGVW